MERKLAGHFTGKNIILRQEKNLNYLLKEGCQKAFNDFMICWGDTSVVFFWLCVVFEQAAIATVVTVVEILKNNGLAIEKSKKFA